MSSKDLFDPELLKAFQNNPPVVVVNSSNLKEVRQFTLQMMSGFPKEERKNVKIVRKIATISGKRVPVIIYTPEGGKDIKPGLLHIHGGGFILGDAQMCETYCCKMAVDLDRVVVSVDYRLAPEHPFPAGLEDCYTALLWMKQESSVLHVDSNDLAITGESGGAGLAAQLSFWIRDRKEVAVRFVFLTYPMLDDRTAKSRDPGKYMGEFFWTRESNVYAWSQYLGSDCDSPVYPSVPSRVVDLQGLPATYIAVGTLDLFATEAIEYALRLSQQGVSTELHLYPGACHGFDYAVETELSKQFFEGRQKAFKYSSRNPGGST